MAVSAIQLAVCLVDISMQLAPFFIRQLPAPAFPWGRRRRCRLRNPRFARLTGFTSAMIITAAATAPILNGEQCAIERVGRYHRRLHPQHADQRQQSHSGFHSAFHREH